MVSRSIYFFLKTCDIIYFGTWRALDCCWPRLIRILDHFRHLNPPPFGRMHGLLRPSQGPHVRRHDHTNLSFERKEGRLLLQVPQELESFRFMKYTRHYVHSRHEPLTIFRYWCTLQPNSDAYLFIDQPFNDEHAKQEPNYIHTATSRTYGLTYWRLLLSWFLLVNRIC